ncbi:MAG: GIY-YIG nuclease family protein [Nanoarchaeota archaeon]|nr:GIY-YIG nuclease family protein [Nanoarchaeota archaeon]
MSKNYGINPLVCTKTLQSFNKGIYCLIIFLPFSKSIKIGKLSTFNFQKGYYCYVGSALNNLEKRISRHKSKNKKIHWHIDYLLEYAKIVEVKTIQTHKRLECTLSKKVSELGDIIINRFGSSDCKCKTHLYFFKTNPTKIREFNNLFSH